MAFVSGMGGGGGRGKSFISPKRQPNNGDVDGNCGCIPMPKPSKSDKRTALLKERIRQFSIWYFEDEEQRENEHVKRRHDRKKKRSDLSKFVFMKFIRLIYWIVAILWIIGLLFTLCSMVSTIGKYTPFYEKLKYKILGPVLLFIAVLLIFLNVVLKRRWLKSKNMQKRKTGFYIIQKKEKTLKESGSKEDSVETDDSGNVEDIEMSVFSKKEKFWARKHTEESDHDHGISQTIHSRGTDLDKVSWGFTTDTPGASSNDHALGEDLRISQKGKEKRQAWAKSKWMQKMSSEDTLDSWESVNMIDPRLESTTTDVCTSSNTGQVSYVKTNYANVAFSTNSSVDSTDNQAKDVPYKFARNFSTKSKMSEVSNFSNFSESAPLVKK